MPTAKSPAPRRKRCLNCNKYFVPKRNVVKKAKYCSDKCRKEFWTHGSAFGPMKLGLYRAIDKKYAELEKSIKVRFREAHKRMEFLEAWKLELRDQSRRIDRLEKIIEGSPTLTVERDQSDARSR